MKPDFSFAAARAAPDFRAFSIALLSGALILSAVIFKAHGESDEAYENRMHNIYLKHYKDPVPYSEWSQLIQSLEKSYQLKYKDNFWDLSGSFFKNSMYWPKLWVANPHAENPHRIFKGDTIKFDTKTLQQAMSSKYGVDVTAQFPDVELPPQKNAKRARTSDEFPSSLPFLRRPDLLPAHLKITFKLNPLETSKEALLPFYLSEEEPAAAGEVISKDGYGAVALNGENVIVEMESSVIEGGLYTVFENTGPFRPRIPDFSDHGYEIKIKGEVKILSYLSGSENMYRARITKSLRAVSKGDWLLQGPAPIYLLSQKGDYGSASGSIIGTPEGVVNMLSLYSLVYLNKGEADGIRPGDIYQVRAASQHRHLKRPYQYEEAPIGSLRVIFANPLRSTAIITENRTQIYAGDTFTNISGFVDDLSQSESHEEIGEIEESPAAPPEDTIPEYAEEIEDEEGAEDEEEHEEEEEDGEDEEDEEEYEDEEDEGEEGEDEEGEDEEGEDEEGEEEDGGDEEGEQEEDEEPENDLEGLEDTFN